MWEATVHFGRCDMPRNQTAMVQVDRQISEHESGAASPASSEEKSHERGLDPSSDPQNVIVDFDLSNLIDDDFLDQELKDFLDQVMATGILIY